MSKKFKKVEEAKNIEEVDVDVKAEEVTAVEKVPDETAAPAVTVDDLSDRGLLEQIYWLLKDLEVKIATAPIAEAKAGKAGKEAKETLPAPEQA